MYYIIYRREVLRLLVLTVQAILRSLEMWDGWRNTGLTFFVYHGLNLNL